MPDSILVSKQEEWQFSGVSDPVAPKDTYRRYEDADGNHRWTVVIKRNSREDRLTRSSESVEVGVAEELARKLDTRRLMALPT